MQYSPEKRNNRLLQILQLSQIFRNSHEIEPYLTVSNITNSHGFLANADTYCTYVPFEWV